MKGFSGARRSALVLAGAFILAAGAAWGQTGWRPDKPIEIIVPTAAGGSNDVIARVVQKIVQGEKLAAVPVNAVNRVGGNQTLSRVYLNQHPGDAHFLHVDNPTVISNHISLANWRAMSGPKGLSPAQIAYWEDTLAKVVATDEWKKALEAQYWAPSFLRSREFAKYLDSEYAVTNSILTELGLAK